MERLIPVDRPDDILPRYRGTPIELLLEYHNLGRPQEAYSRAQLLVGMCMDNRKQLDIPDNFAFILRTGGANLRHSEFKVSYAIAVGGLHTVAIIGHTQCGMVNLGARRELFVEGLVEHAGWDRELAEQHFLSYAPIFEIVDPIDFTRSEAHRLRDRYPRLRTVAPLIYRVEDNRLYQIEES